MTADVHSYPLISKTYAGVGKTFARNRCPIIMLRFPEREVLATRVHPRSTLSKERVTR